MATHDAVANLLLTTRFLWLAAGRLLTLYSADLTRICLVATLEEIPGTFHAAMPASKLL